MIVDEDYYTNEYNGQVVPTDNFEFYSKKAENYLRYYANGTNNIGCDDDVKLCICEMMDAYVEDEITPSGSESLGGWSVSGASSRPKLDAKLNSIIEKTLHGKGWVCRWL